MAEDFLRPDADDTDGNWTDQAGGTSLFAAIDETSANDSDYIRSGADPNNDICKIRLGNPGSTPTEPVDVMYRYRKSGSGTMNLKVRLLQGATEIGSWSHTDISTSFVDAEQTLTAPQFAAISDFDDLFIEFNANPPSLLLDSYTVGAVYSMRRLRTDYEGDCVRIRADAGTGGDDAEEDFGFIDDVVDTAGIASFISTHGGTPKITDWYDQSGNSFTLSQATTANQPAFIASGINSLPTARFDGSNDNLDMSASPTALVNSDEGTIFVVQLQDGAQAQNTTLFNTQLNIHATYDNTIYWDFGTSAGRVSGSQPGGWDNAGHVLEVFRLTDDTQTIVVDGSTIATDTQTATVSSGVTSFHMGSQGSGAAPLFKGDISEMFFIKTGEGSTNRTAIRTDLGAYYGISV